MAKKIDSAIAERLTALGIKAKSEEDARTKLLKILADNDIDGMEEEDTDSLLDMAESMVDVESTDPSDDDDDRSEDEREADELAEEVAEEDGDEDEDDEEEDDEDDSEDEDEEEDEDEKPAKKSSPTKKSAAPAKSVAKSAKAEKKEPAKKAEKKEPAKKAEKKQSKRGLKLDPMHNEDDRKAFKFLKKFFPIDKYEYRWLATNGVTVKYKGANSNRAMVLIETCSKQANGDITCNLYLLTFSKSLQQLDDKGIEYELCWNGAPFLRGITFTEVEEIITELLELMEETVSEIDKRLGDNRKKMEASLKKTTKKDAAKKATKTKTAEPEDEDDSEDEDEAPAKKAKKSAKKSAPAKKVAKKAEPEDEDEDDDEEDEDYESKKPAKKAVKKSKK